MTLAALGGITKEVYCCIFFGTMYLREVIMNKVELAAAIANETGLSKKDSEAAVKAFVEVVTNELKKGERVQLVGFGTFEVAERAAREGRNPQTGKTMKIKASKAPRFKAGKALKDAVNTPKKKK